MKIEQQYKLKDFGDTNCSHLATDYYFEYFEK